MADVTRTGVSIEPELLDKFDNLISKRGYKNRAVVATLSMVYDHHRHDLSNKLNEIQHHSHHNVLAATHVHLDHDNCLEVVIMKGRSGEIKRLADQMLSMRGVKHGKLVITSTGKDL